GTLPINIEKLSKVGFISYLLFVCLPLNFSNRLGHSWEVGFWVAVT
ncbi:hypothetical protein LINPERPRIM_LOCUS25008, partial [Linum perenne]